MANRGIGSIFFQFANLIPYGDKVGHFFVYGILAMLFNLALNCRTFRFDRLSLQQGGCLVFIFTSIDELSQYFFPSRSLDYLDVIANILGILIFNALSKTIRKKYLV